jgi:hypothetical protein
LQIAVCLFGRPPRQRPFRVSFGTWAPAAQVKRRTLAGCEHGILDLTRSESTITGGTPSSSPLVSTPIAATGEMNVTQHRYAEITGRIVESATQWCQDRVVSLLEGGYHREGLAASVAEHVEALHGASTA